MTTPRRTSRRSWPRTRPWRTTWWWRTRSCGTCPGSATGRMWPWTGGCPPIRSSGRMRTRTRRSIRAGGSAGSTARRSWVHPSALAFAQVALTEAEVAGKTVLEAGALDVNGSARPHVEAFGPASYTGTDMRAGPRVDVVCPAEELPTRFRPASADVLLSTEMLEHAASWRAAMNGMITVLAPGGVLVLTTRGPGFPVHGYPSDFWRFTVPVMRQILEAAGLEVLVCIPDSDPQSPGVFAKARKPERWQRPWNLTQAWARVEV